MKPKDNIENNYFDTGVYKDYDIEYLVKDWKEKNQSLYYGEISISYFMWPFLQYTTPMHFNSILELVKLHIRNNFSCAPLTLEELTNGLNDLKKVNIHTFSRKKQKIYFPITTDLVLNYLTVILPLVEDVLQHGETEKYLTFRTLSLTDDSTNSIKQTYGKLNNLLMDVDPRGGSTRLVVYQMLYDDSHFIKKSFLFDTQGGKYDFSQYTQKMKKLTDAEIVDILIKNEYGLYEIHTDTLMPVIFSDREEPYKYNYQPNTYMNKLGIAILENKLHIKNFNVLLDMIDNNILDEHDISYTEETNRKDIKWPISDSPNFSLWSNNKQEKYLSGLFDNNYRKITGRIAEIYSYIGTTDPLKATYVAEINDGQDLSTIMRSLLGIFSLFFVQKEHENNNYSIRINNNEGY